MNECITPMWLLKFAVGLVIGWIIILFGLAFANEMLMRWERRRRG